MEIQPLGCRFDREDKGDGYGCFPRGEGGGKSSEKGRTPAKIASQMSFGSRSALIE